MNLAKITRQKSSSPETQNYSHVFQIERLIIIVMFSYLNIKYFTPNTHLKKCIENLLINYILLPYILLFLFKCTLFSYKLIINVLIFLFPTHYIPLFFKSVFLVNGTIILGRGSSSTYYTSQILQHTSMSQDLLPKIQMNKHVF